MKVNTEGKIDANGWGIKAKLWRWNGEAISRPETVAEKERSRFIYPYFRNGSRESEPGPRAKITLFLEAGDRQDPLPMLGGDGLDRKALPFL